MLQNSLFKYVLIAASILWIGSIATSCNKDEVIEAPESNGPSITLDSPDAVYTTTVNTPITISPSYTNALNASFLWTIDALPVADTPTLTYSWDKVGQYYVTVTVTTSNGSASEEMRVDVVEPGVPVISLPIKSDNVTILIGSDYVITPEFSNSTVAGFNVRWTIDGKPAGNEHSLTFHANEIGKFHIAVTASNNEGSSSRSFNINVANELPIQLEFPRPTFFNSSTTRYTFPGRPVYLTPFVDNAEALTFSWTLDGQAVDCSASTYRFLTETPGTYTVSVTVNSQYTAAVTVICVNSSESARYRRAGASSSAASTRVFEYIPGPGQFIGDTQTGGMTGPENTPELANEWASRRIANSSFVSLGAWGGYIIVGFDHSIPAKNSGYDFAVLGNAFLNAVTNQGGSNEPGIIYVMQDVNGNGIPDDEWYELRGSETGKSTTIQNYRITYYRPAGSNMNVIWTDCLSQQGTVDYLTAFHRQSSYYPAWIEADNYTLYGTRIEARTTQDATTGNWDNWKFDWGYADNIGSDNLTNSPTEDSGQYNGFKISNAMYPDLSDISLQYIDFIKVQTGVNAKAGHLGENSTEILGFRDLSLEN